jgi:hypothetical protein
MHFTERGEVKSTHPFLPEGQRPGGKRNLPSVEMMKGAQGFQAHGEGFT